MVPDTDFPDIRCQAFVHSNAGTLFVIPRENDLIRLYIQQSSTQDILDPQTGRVDKNRTSPEELIEQGKKIFLPYRIVPKDGNINWWTVYAGKYHRFEWRLMLCRADLHIYLRS